MFGANQNLVSVGEVLYPGNIGAQSFDPIKPGAEQWVQTVKQIATFEQPKAAGLLAEHGPHGGRFGNLCQNPMETPIGSIAPYRDNVFHHTFRTMVLTYANQFDTQGNIVITPAEAQLVANQIVLPHDIMEAMLVNLLGLGTDVSRIDGSAKDTRIKAILGMLEPLRFTDKDLEFGLAGQRIGSALVYKFLLFQRATDFVNRKPAQISLAYTDLEMLGKLSAEQSKLVQEDLKAGEHGDMITTVARLIAQAKLSPNKPTATDQLSSLWAYILESAEGNMTYMNNVVALMTAPWFDVQQYAAYIPGDRSLGYPLGDVYASYYALQRFAEAHREVVGTKLYNAAHYTLAAQRAILARLVAQGIQVPAFAAKWANVPQTLQALVTTKSTPVFEKTPEPISPRELSKAKVAMKKPVKIAA